MDTRRFGRKARSSKTRSPDKVRAAHDPDASATAPFSREVAERSRAKEERVTTSRAARRKLDARFQTAFDGAPIGMALVDLEGRWLEVNAALSRITGYSRDELCATTLRAITHPEDVALDAELERQLSRGQIPSYQIEKRYRHARGHHLWVLVSVSLVRDHRAQPLYVISQVQDFSARKEAAEHLEHLVDHDFLTGLFNRRRFEHELAKEVRRGARYRFSGAVVLIDLDHFKEVNDALGHKAGDDLLEAIAQTLRRRVRRTDVLARVGGDEFAVLLPQTDADQAEFVARGIVQTLRRQVVAGDNGAIRVTASVGVALFDGLDTDALMSRADRAMYEGKAAGRDCFVMHRPTSKRD